jgi:uncharacterized membrane protein
MELTPTIAVHATAATLGTVVGPFALWARLSGRQRPQLHRIAGYVFVVSMLVAACSAIFIRDFKLPNISGYTPIHVLIPATLFGLFGAFWALRQRRLDLHRRIMVQVYAGACVVAGAFTLLPSRLIGGWLWHDLLGVSSAQLAIVPMVLRHVPPGVWLLLAVLLALGVMQLRPRRVSLLRAMVMPVALLVGSAAGVVSSFGIGLFSAVWAAATLALGALWLQVPLWPGVRWDDWREQFQMPGSIVPLVLIVLVFVLKLTVGATLALAPHWAGQLNFALPVVLLYALVNGLMGARAWQLWRLTRSRTLRPPRTPALPQH